MDNLAAEVSEQVLVEGVRKPGKIPLEYSQVGEEVTVVVWELLVVVLGEPVGEHVEAAGVVGDDS